MWCRRKDMSSMVRTLQVLLLHVHFITCALPPAVRDADNHDSHTGNGGGRDDSKNPFQRHIKHKAYWGGPNTNQHMSNDLNSREHRWATAAFDFVHNLDCDDVFFTTSRECRELVSLPKSAMNVYMADPSPYGKFRTVIPDEPLTGTGLHEAVVVVDPYPAANFGHLVVIFFVDSDVSRSHCQKMGGVYLATCMHRRHHPSGVKNISELAGFARCPEFRPANDTDGLICNHLRENTRRCSTTHETIRTSCRMFEICDQAVLLSGGWNRYSSGERHWRNIELMYAMLRDNGFKRRNVKVFFANGAKSLNVFLFGDPRQSPSPQRRGERRVAGSSEFCIGGYDVSFRGCLGGRLTIGQSPPPVIDVFTDLEDLFLHSCNFKSIPNVTCIVIDGDPPQKVYPAALKLALRNHIAKLCMAPHCVDSLFLYLNSPARSDGSSLLWDVNGDGLADDHERYTVRELKEDLSHCAAKQVTVVVDQSFSGEVVQELRQSPAHANVLVFASGKSGEYSFGDEYTRFWAARNHTRACSTDIHS
ncbi:hypothetical protein BaRGS_00009342, partial [Batillaria attramentaria]